MDNRRLRSSTVEEDEDEEIEPYVRRRSSASCERKRPQGISEEDERVLRSSINSRERRRMHDLNEAMEDLRSTLPYSAENQSASNGNTAQSGKRMSKISTLILAANWIRHLTKANESLRAELDIVTRHANGAKPELSKNTVLLNCTSSLREPKKELANLSTAAEST